MARTITGAALACTLAACSAYGPGGLPPGAPLATIEQSMGAPTGRYTLADGRQRLEYARGPMGLHTYMLDLDGDGRLLRADQVLTENHFNALAVGETQQQVLATIGHPGETTRYARQGQTVWSYHYDSTFCTWFQVSFDATDRVVETGYGTDPRCDPHDTDM